MRWWKILGLAGFAGVAATGVVIARAERRRRAYTPDQIRAQLQARLAEASATPPTPPPPAAPPPRPGPRPPPTRRTPPRRPLRTGWWATGPAGPRRIRAATIAVTT